ncbi:MAG: 2-polyprenylphenol 6-hydroxylase [Endozoicomonadaceae bacterium]|nr:2-polyprenylphenol 6-hydroxylase [Endozoicomonadaceae bacterium]MBE8232523.1 2-polyprenylphenol 6-hydroxylase [Endozoicomonadaceae bacterium]
MTKYFRFMTILSAISYYRLDTLIPKTYWPRFLFIGLRPFFMRKPKQSEAVRLRLALEKLGPVFIKLGQQISTRPDLIPHEIAQELAKLQDQAPPFSSELAIQIIENTFKKPITCLFKTFHEQPLAAASVAQVHEAYLPTGEHVVVKIIRPDITRIIQQDIALLYQLAKILNILIPDIRRLRLLEVIDDYKKKILDELDLNREAASASQLRRNFKASNILYVPKIYWPYCDEKVMVLEYIRGVPIHHREELIRQGVNVKKLAEAAVLVFFKQVFHDNFFHADMHPGNIFVNIDNPKTPYFIAIDFGIMGSLSIEDQSYLARNLLAFFHQDYKKVAELHISSGWVDSETTVYALESEIRMICERTFGCALGDISLAGLLVGLFKAAKRFDMSIQPQLILLEKTLLNIEGIGRQLYPQLNLWETAKPFLEEWIRQRVSPWPVVKRINSKMPDWIESLPISIHHAIRKIITPTYSTSKKQKNGYFKTIGICCVMIGLLSQYSMIAHHIPFDLSWILVAIGVLLYIKPFDS